MIKISLKFAPRGPINHIFQHRLRYWLGADQATSPYLNQWWLVYWYIYTSLGLSEWTHWDLNKMVATLQMTFFMTSSWIAVIIYWLDSYWIWLLGVNWQSFSIDSGNALGSNRHQAIIWSIVDSDLWCHYLMGFNVRKTWLQCDRVMSFLH